MINIKSTQQNYDKHDISPASLYHNYQFIDSSLIDYSHLDFLSNLLTRQGFKNPKLELKYRATIDGDNNFHRICNGIANNVMIIKAKENGVLFGGFTRNGWSSNGTYSHD